jgi:hypothetical protein
MGILTGKADVVANMPSFDSKAQNWIQWHKDLKSNFGKKIANGLWLKAWRNRGSSGGDINTSDLRDYMKKQGVTIDTTTWNKVSDATVSGLSDLFQMSRTTSFVITGTVVGLAIYIVYKVLKNPKESIQTASLFTPQGRAISMGGGFNK